MTQGKREKKKKKECDPGNPRPKKAKRRKGQHRHKRLYRLTPVYGLPRSKRTQASLSHYLVQAEYHALEMVRDYSVQSSWPMVTSRWQLSYFPLPVPLAPRLRIQPVLNTLSILQPTLLIQHMGIFVCEGVYIVQERGERRLEESAGRVPGSIKKTGHTG